MVHRTLRIKYDGLNPQGRPYAYIFDLVGAMTIKLWPMPAETLTPVPNANLYDSTVLQNNCVVEYYASPDGAKFKLPPYMRRRTIKAYVMYKAYMSEGKGQNLKASAYWKKRWEFLKELNSSVLHELYENPRKLTASNVERYPTVPRPVLPLKLIGIGVEDDDDGGG
jgi:hypothetical protein